jgi:protein CpxP
MVADMQHRREQRLHDLLQIKPDQETAFRTFVTAQEQGRPQGGPPGAERKPLTTPERLDREAQRIAQLQQRLAAVKTFYAVLTPDQRKAFDQMPMMMGRGGGMMRGRFEGRLPRPIR